MATYYIDPDNGSDANNGLGPNADDPTNKPFATIAYACNTAATTSVANTFVLKCSVHGTLQFAWAKPTAAQTIIGDHWHQYAWKTPQVPHLRHAILTNYTSGFTTTPAALNVIANTFNKAINLTTFRYLYIIAGGNQHGFYKTAHSSNQPVVDVTVQDCLFRHRTTATQGTGVACFYWIHYQGDTENLVVERCYFDASNVSIYFQDSLHTAEYDANAVIRNNVFEGNQQNGCIGFGASGSGTYTAGGFDILNNRFKLSANVGVNGYAGQGATYPCNIRQNIFEGADAATGVSHSVSGAFVSDENVYMVNTPRSGSVTKGTNDVDGYVPIVYPPPSRAFITVPDQYMEIPGVSPLVGLMTTTAQSSTDHHGRPRPGSGSANVTPGACEAVGLATRETTTTQAGANAIRLTGPSVHEFDLPVDATSTSVKIYARFASASYGGTNYPRVSVLNGAECGVNDASASATASASDAWEQVTVGPFTPTAKGIITVRLENRSTASSGVCYFDTFSVA